MRCPKGLAGGIAGLLAVGMAGCTSSAPASARSPKSAVDSASSAPNAPAASESAVALAGPAEPETKDGVHASAATFYRLYSTGQFAASWELLSPAAQRDIPRTTWVSVHNACPPAGIGASRIVKSVLVFGSAAIVTETIAGADSRLGKAEDVFNYAHGHWGYMPNDIGVYHHGSVHADVAAAKALGFCTGRKSSPM
jgi:hypothetical protein